MRTFGLEEANRLIPLLQDLFSGVREKAKRAQDVTKQLTTAATGTSEHATLRVERDALVSNIQAALQTVADLGAEVKALDGLVDFPSSRHGRTVYLCWKFGEHAVSHWHEVDDGYGARQPIKEPVGFTPTYLS
jgi:hypothetical protein